jgi:hypothetical protein
MISFKVFNRFSGDIQFTAKIDAKQADSEYVKLGLAVRWAHENGASLDGASLDGARLVGARLVGASLDGASLDRASLDRASLVGASLVGARLVGARLVGASLVGASLVGASLDRASLDRASLVGASLDRASLVGASLVGKTVAALCGRATRNDGCEFFMWLFDDGSHIIKAGCRTFTIDQFSAHVAASYPDTPKATETLAIIDFLEARLKAVSAELPTPRTPSPEI